MRRHVSPAPLTSLAPRRAGFARRRPLRRGLAGLVCLFALLVAPLAAQEPGAEFLVSEGPRVGDPPAAGETPRVAMNAAGAFVVAYNDQRNAIRIRRYDPDGNALDSPSEATDTRWRGIGRPAVAMSNAGTFVVVWQAPTLSEFTPYSIGMRLYRESGETLRGPEQVNTRFTPTQTQPAVAMQPDGRFLVAWAAFNSGSSEGFDFLLFRRYRADGTTSDAGDRVLIEGAARAPDVAPLPDGGYVVIWYQNGAIYGARVPPEGERITYLLDGARLDTDPRGSPLFPSVATAPDGSFTVAWHQTLPNRIVARRFTAAGRPAGLDFTVDVTRPPGLFPGYTERLGMTQPGIATLAGGPVIAWPYDNDLESGGDNEIVFRRLSATGFLDQSEQQVAERFRDGAHFPDVASNRGDRFVIVWQDDYDYCEESCEGAEVYARLYQSRGAYAVTASPVGTYEGSGERVVFSVTRAQATSEGRVGYTLGGTAIFGEDYRLTAAPSGVVSASGALTFPAGVREQRLELSLVDDLLGEPAKTIVLTLRPLSAGDRIAFPYALVSLSDDDPAAIKVTQTGGGTVVRQGAPPDRIALALRTAPAHPVSLVLRPNDPRINLGSGFGAPHQLSFPAGEQAKEQQWVTVSARGAGPDLAAGGLTITLEASSADGGYARGARLLVDGEDQRGIPVTLLSDSGESAPPLIPRAYLPLVLQP